MGRPDSGLCFIRFLRAVCLITSCLLRFVFLLFSFFARSGRVDAPRSAHGVYVYLRVHPMKSRGHFSYLAVVDEPVHPDDPLTWVLCKSTWPPFLFFYLFLFSSFLLGSFLGVQFLGCTSRPIGTSGAPTVISIVHRHGRSAAQAIPARPLL